jgi:hypothetical protein
MLNGVLQSIESVTIYPIIGLVIFVSAFAVVIVNTWRMTKSEVEYAGRLPLDDGTVETVPGSNAMTEGH